MDRSIALEIQQSGNIKELGEIFNLRSGMKKFFLALCSLLFATASMAFSPQAGTWIVTAENNGKPGRGIALDVQNSTLLMQIYAYEADGSPTFYLTAGQISDNSYSGQLNQYAGGRYLGSGPRSGYELRNLGLVKVRFVTGIKGYITFPGEAEVEISRFGFGYGETPQNLIGVWTLLTANPSTGIYAAMFGNMNRVSDQTVYSSDGTLGCRYTGTTPGEVVCIQMQNGQQVFATRFILSVNDGEGFSGPNVNSLTAPTTVRRLTTPSGIGTGLVVRSVEVQNDDRDREMDAALTSAIILMRAQ